MNENKFEVLSYGAEYTGAIKMLLERGFDFGDRKSVAEKTAALHDEIIARINSASTEDDRLFRSCHNIFDIVHHTKNYDQRMELYCKIFHIDVPRPLYRYFYDEKITETVLCGIAAFVDDRTDRARYEPVWFTAGSTTYSGIIKKLKRQFDGIYYKPDGIRFEQAHRERLTSYAYHGAIYTEKEALD